MLPKPSFYLYYFFLAFTPARFSHATQSGPAMHTELYTPETIPIISGNENVKILSKPKTTLTTHTVPSASSVVRVVLTVRLRTLVDTTVHKLGKICMFFAQQRFIFSDTVIDNNCVIDRVPQNNEHGRNKVPIQRNAQHYKNAENYYHVVQQSDNARHSTAQPANILETNCDINEDKYSRCQNSHDAFGKKFTAQDGVNVGDRKLLEVVAWVILLQGCCQYFHCFGAHRLAAGHGYRQCLPFR